MPVTILPSTSTAAPLPLLMTMMQTTGGQGSRLVRHLKCCKIICACIFRGSKVASEQGSSIPPIIITDAMKKDFMKKINFASMKKITNSFY
jgi:hypothetical protein